MTEFTVLLWMRSKNEYRTVQAETPKEALDIVLTRVRKLKTFQWVRAVHWKGEIRVNGLKVGDEFHYEASRAKVLEVRDHREYREVRVRLVAPTGWVREATFEWEKNTVVVVANSWKTPGDKERTQKTINPDEAFWRRIEEDQVTACRAKGMSEEEIKLHLSL